MQHGVLDTAHVQVNPAVAGGCVRGHHPVPLNRRVHQLPGVGRVKIAQAIPAGSGPLRHRVEFAAVPFRAVAQVEFGVGPLRGAGQRRHWVTRLACLWLRLEVRHIGQRYWQRFLGKRDGQPVLVVDDRERLTPVALPGEQPVTQPVGTLALPSPGRFQPADGGRDPGLLPPAPPSPATPRSR